MSRSTRFMTGGLATVAVASAFTLAGPAAQAAETDEVRGCGQPAVDAVYDTVVREPLLRAVPAVTHDEWTWERDVVVPEFEFTRTLSAPRVESDWVRVLPGATEYLFQRTVTDTPAVPAVPGTPEIGHSETIVVTAAVFEVHSEYVHETTGKVRWERDDWGAQNGQGKGWKKTGRTQETEVTPAVTTQRWIIDVPAVPSTPAVPAVTHVESRWAPSAPGDGWTGPLEESTGPSTTEELTTAGETPDGAGWALAATRSFAAVTETVWAAETPAGYSGTGASRTAHTLHEQTEAPSPVAPTGDGWSAMAGSVVTVTDSAETVEVVVPGTTENVLVTAGLPATEPCPEGAIISDGGPRVDSFDPAGPQAAPAAAHTTTPTASGLPTIVQASTGLPNTGLPNTGLPNTGGVPGWMAPVGLATMIAGAILVRSTRRRTDLI